MKKKLFISHASEDKDDFVRPLAKALSDDFDVWYDEYQLVMGDSLLEKISKGLSTCDFGVVILSQHFFAKKWTQQELNGLFALEERDKKVILPVWKGISNEDVKRYCPILADRVAAKAEDGVDNVVKEIKKAVMFFERGRSVEKPMPGLHRLRMSLQKKTERERSKRIVCSPQGVSIVMNAVKQTIDTLHDQIQSLRGQPSGKGIRIDGPKGNTNEYQIKVWVGQICLKVYYRNNVINSAMDAQIEFFIFHSKINSWGRISQSNDRESYSPHIDLNDNVLWRSKGGQLLSFVELVDKWLEKFSKRIEKR